MTPNPAKTVRPKAQKSRKGLNSTRVEETATCIETTTKMRRRRNAD
jgi:hypothetical protein